MLHNAHDSVDDVISAASMAETILQRGCQWLLEHLPLSVSLQKRVHRTNVALQEPSAHTDEFLQPRRGLASSSLPLQPPLTHSFTHRGYELHLLTAMPAQPNLDSAPPVTASSGVSVANELARPGYIIQDVGGALPSPFHNIQAGLLNNAIDLKQPVCQLVLDLQAAIVPVDDSGEPVHAVPLLPTASGASALVNNAAAGASTARLAVSEDALQSRQLYVSAVEGTVFSPNCHANYTANVHSYQLEVGALQETSSSYAAIAVFIACTQIGLLVLQIYHSGSAAQALKLSILSVCAHAVLDALLCIGHLLLSSAVPGLLLRDLLWLAILKLIIFCVFEMRLAISAYQAQYAQEANPEGTMGLRRRLAAMHLRFYGAVFASMFIALSLSSQPLWLVPLLYSFWVPQIVYNVTHVVRRALHPVYIVGMSLTRMFIPLYLYGWPNSFVHYILLDDGSQEIEHARAACVLLVLWVSLQAVVLLLQDRFGSRFLVPKAWLPERYDYYRDLPQGVHARPISGDNVSSGDHGADGEAGIALNVVEGGRSSVHTGAGDYSECVVCYNPIEAIPGSYMVAPCDHTFHRDCLTHWMQVKSECPTCRATLPPDELAEAD